MRNALDARGIDIPLVGTEYLQESQYNYNWDSCKAYLGAWENHNYDSVGHNVWAERPISDLNYPVLWGEFAGHDNTDYNWNIRVAKWCVGGANNKIDGFARWSYVNQNNIDGIFGITRKLKVYYNIFTGNEKAINLVAGYETCNLYNNVFFNNEYLATISLSLNADREG